jgi:hypothetical protein
VYADLGKSLDLDERYPPQKKMFDMFFSPPGKKKRRTEVGGSLAHRGS